MFSRTWRRRCRANGGEVQPCQQGLANLCSGSHQQQKNLSLPSTPAAAAAQRRVAVVQQVWRRRCAAAAPNIADVDAHRVARQQDLQRRARVVAQTLAFLFLVCVVCVSRRVCV